MSTIKAVGGSLAAIILGVAAQILAVLCGELLVSAGVSGVAGNIVSGILYPVLTLVFFFVLARILKIRLSDVGITGFKLKLRWIVAAVLLPIAVTGVYLLLPGAFASSGMDSVTAFSRLSAGVFFSGIGAGFAEEMIFRGFVMRLLKKRWNTKLAVILPSVLFGLVHIIGMEFSFVSCLLVIAAGTAVGIMFSLISLEGENIWNDGFVHCIWNIVIIGGTICISHSADPDSLWTYVLDTDSFVMTGGEFGIESSVIAVAGYIIVTLAAFLFLRRKKTDPEVK